MKIKLYQIAPEKDDKNLMFMNYEWTVEHGGVHSGPYELVFDGEVDAKTTTQEEIMTLAAKYV